MVWRLVSRRRYLLHNESPEPPAMPCRWLNRTGFLTGSGHHPHVNYFSFFPSSSRPPSVLRCTMSLWLRFLAPAGRLASISLRRRLFIFLSGTKVLLLKGRWRSPEAEFAPWRPKTSNWRSEPLERGWDFCLSAPRSVRHATRRRGQVACRWITIGWREGNGKVTRIDA